QTAGSPRLVLAAEGATCEHGRCDDARPGSIESLDHRARLDVLRVGEAVGQLRRNGLRNTRCGGDPTRLLKELRLPVEDAPGTELSRRDQVAHHADQLVERQARGRLLRVLEVEIVEAHALE